MARYLATSVCPRGELLPDHDDSVDLGLEALLDENERRKLKSYRPPSGIEQGCDTKPTVRWTPAELENLLSIARATIEADPVTADDPSTSPPTSPPARRVAVRRSEVIMADVRARLRRSDPRT
jgi:hypothetical protein